MRLFGPKSQVKKHLVSLLFLKKMVSEAIYGIAKPTEAYSLTKNYEVYMKKTILILLCFLLSCCLLIACHPKESESPTAELQYNINVKLDGNALNGKQTVTFRNVFADGLNEAVFHLYPNAYSENAEHKAYGGILPAYGGIEITAVTSCGEAADASYDDEKQYLTVALPSSSIGDRITIDMEYTVTIPDCRLRFGRRDNVYLLSSFYPQLAVYENGAFRRDPFCTVGDPIYSDEASYELSFTCPSSLVVASSAKAESKTDEGELSTYVYKADAIRDFALAASPDFNVLTARENDVDLFFFSVNDAGAEEHFSVVRSAFDRYTEAFGSSDLKSYSVVFAPFDYGGMEFGGLTYVSSSAGENTEETLLHETAHQWWYHLVGSDPINQSALDEGLTAFSSAYYYLLAGDEDAFSEKIADTKKVYTQYETLQKRRQTGIDLSADGTIYDYTSYQYTMLAYYKSCLLFNNLYELYGKEKTTACLRAYAEECAHKTATFDDFISACNKVLKTDIGGLVKGWLGDGPTVTTFGRS